MGWEEEKQNVLGQLDDEIQLKLPGDSAESVRDFAVQFYRSFPAEDLQDRRVADIFGVTYGNWQFLARYDGQEAKVRVFNPDFEKHGWHLNHTVVVVLCRNMPFCVDSVRGELNRRHVAVHVLHSENFRILRDNEKFQRLLAPDDLPDEFSAESLLYLEITRHSDQDVCSEIAEALVDVLREVRLAIESFQAMCDQAIAVAEAVASAPNGGTEEKTEVEAFCRWLVDGHLTFLGYECFSIEYTDSHLQLRSHQDKALGLLAKRKTRGEETLAHQLTGREEGGLRQQLTFSKSSVRSRVHRTVYPDYIAIKEYDSDGKILRWHRFMGLFTSLVYTQSLDQVPVIASKVAEVIEASKLDRNSHEGKELLRVLEVLPRDEVFQCTVDQLTRTALSVVQLKERRKVRLIMRRDSSSAFFSCLVFSPRDSFNTELRLKMRDILCDALGALESEFTTFFSESVLARVHFVIRVDPQREISFDERALERAIYQASLYWPDQLQTLLVEEYGEELGDSLGKEFAEGFSPGYCDDFEPRVAVHDIARIQKLESENDIAMSFYRVIGEAEQALHFRLFHRNHPLSLSDVMPILENLGMQVARETPYEILGAQGQVYWVQDFSLVYALDSEVELEHVEQKFKDAFAAVWYGQCESDSFNRLLVGTQLTWREISVLRAYAHYMKQIQFPFSSEFIADTLSRHLPLTLRLYSLFRARFEPQSGLQESEIADEVLASLDAVADLSEDRVVREFYLLMRATVRTNYFQSREDGSCKPSLSLKLLPEKIADLPLPRPRYEIFVYSPRVEGVHLRGGAVARGGLRWSERHEDFRTEVLGLVKAQQVKNAVIVPVGAKGGFVCKQMPTNASREEIQAEGIACYRQFITGLLDITDNLVSGKVVVPADMVRHDGDDTYLVVAADKGTATFSDIANGISADYNFWLGDAFASGGSVGYDHKKMGITARGAWVSVQRHFREFACDVQNQDFTVIGIGDMAGDVFGNGMLLSNHIRLLAAFNHRHIFIDPNPDPASSYVERKRLFDTSGSGWDDYDATLISKGGAVFDRSAKSIQISMQMKQCFAIDADSLTPADLISALLCAPVDLIWNGGIGTYVKSSSESHAEVGDKANDGLRVNARDLRCRVVGEGGNLGMTQLGRIEFALQGGRVNTDFIDNAAGVDCSDHEVNVKILLNTLVAAGDMTFKQRDQLLVDMTENVADLVLRNNYAQVQAISLAEHQAMRRAGEFRRLISQMVEQGKLDRGLEYLPEDDALVERNNHGMSLTRPELSVLVSYSKADLKEEFMDSVVGDDALLGTFVRSAFPTQVVRQFDDEIGTHQLRREIIATQVANDLVNHMGVHFVPRLANSTGASPAIIAQAYVTVRTVLGVAGGWQAIEALDYKVDSAIQLEMMQDIRRLVRRASRWFIRNRRTKLDPAREVETFSDPVGKLAVALPTLLQGHLEETRLEHRQRLLVAGVPEKLADMMAVLQHRYSLLGIAEAARDQNADAHEFAQLYFKLGEYLEIDWFASQVLKAKVENNWQAIARETFLDDLEWQQRLLTVGALQHMEQERNADECIRIWAEHQSRLVDRWRLLIQEMHTLQIPEYAMFSVAIRELMNLAQSSVH